MQEDKQILHHLYRTEKSKITAVLVKLFGFEHIEIAEDIVSDTFLAATETWQKTGLPIKPIAWLYTVAKNKARDYLKHNQVFLDKVIPGIKGKQSDVYEIEIDLSPQNIVDSQLQMMFAICHPSISKEAQIGLSLKILCGFSIEEIASAFLTKKDTIQKRLDRAKLKLKKDKAEMVFPNEDEIHKRLEAVLITLYLLFNEGYYSISTNKSLRKDLCLEAMRLNFLLVENENTNLPQVNALLSLMCFHSSRFEARIDSNGINILYDDQDSRLWNRPLIEKGEYFLSKATEGKEITKYHLEAAIAYWHTVRSDSEDKWENILQLYNKLLVLEYSPMAALNRTLALAKSRGKKVAILEAQKLSLKNHFLYYSLLGYLFTGLDQEMALAHFNTALNLAKTVADKNVILKYIQKLSDGKVNTWV